MYIRTIMGSIYKVDNNKYGVIEENGIFKKYCENMGHSWYSELVATKQSETIEELCDEFVGLIKDRSSDFIITKVIAHSLKELKDSLKTELNGKTYQSKYDIIYGAIWTDKGLIYVAKMNEKGELELIWQE